MADDPFTVANKLKTQTVAIDRARDVITTREAARQKAIDTARRREREDIDLGIKINQENRAQESHDLGVDQTNMKIEALAMELKQQRDNIAQRASDDAFAMFDATGDPAVLTNLFKNNPALRKAEAAGGPEIVSFDKIDPINDKELINRSGLDPSIFAEENAIKQYIRTTDAAGNKDIIDVDKIKAATGFYRPGRLGSQMLDHDLKRRQLLNKGGSRNITQDLATLKDIAMTMTGKAEPDLTLEDLQAAAGEKGNLGLNKPVKKTAAERKADMREENTNAIFDAFGGEEEFYNTDFSKPENKRKIAQELAERKKDFKESQLSATERKKFREIKKLLNLSETATGELTASSTGIIDSAFADVKKFLSDEVGEVKGRSAYAAYRNVIRHALFGSVLTRGETESFKQAFGDLGQQLGPVLQQLAVSVEQIKSDMEGLANFADPIIAHIELGSTQEQIDAVLEQLNERIRIIDEMATTGTITIKEAPAPERFRTPGINPDAERSISDFNFTTGE